MSILKTAWITEHRLVADLGLSEEEVVELLTENRPVDEQIVRRAERHRGVNEGHYEQWIGQHIQSFYQKAVCSEASVPTANGTLTAPLFFISAIAGILLASEFVKSSVPDLQPYVLQNYFRLDTLHAPTAAFHERRGQEPTGRCICWDEDYRRAYRAKYES